MSSSLPPDYPWGVKLSAFLHDPAHKALVLGTGLGHEKQAQTIASGFGLTGELTPEGGPVHQADQIAAAADRNQYLGSHREHAVYWTSSKPHLTHPLGGIGLELSVQPLGETLRPQAEKLTEKLNALLSGNRKSLSSEDKYLWLWWAYFSEAAKVAGGDWQKYFELLPADTRQPDHSLQQHLSMTAALAAALQEGMQPAFVVFGIGPVQKFITAARRTADLWAGSWLLSYLTWKAIEAIIDQVGPDVIVFPSLRRQPLVQHWLNKKPALSSLISAPSDDLLRIASFPNRFVAILPYAAESVSPFTAQSLVKKAEKTVCETWVRLAEEVKDFLQKAIHSYWDKLTDKFWEEQIRSFPEVYWSIFPWPGDFHRGYAASESLWETLLCKEPPASPPLKNPNWGNAYAKLYQLAERAYGTTKLVRRHGFMKPSFGEPSTLNPSYAALQSESHPPKAFWKELSDALQRQNIYLLSPEGRERLDALSAVKRFLFQSGSLPIARFSFPSVSEIAAAPFKQHVLNQKNSLENTVKSLIDAIQAIDPNKEHFFYESPPIPIFSNQGEGSIWEDFLRLEASWLYDTHWEAAYLERQDYVVEETKRRTIQTALRALYRAAAMRPSGYYAILYMDGDHMGRWLSGTHESIPFLREVVHESLSKKVPSEVKRPLTPALHAFISEALGFFSLRMVPHIIEKEHLGVVVYAGGDDVLAFLPAEEALKAAHKLRAAFSGCIRWKNGQAQVDWEQKSGYVEGENGPYPTMGPKATASIGIGIAHHRHPLDLALEAAFAAEKTAKNIYGRNALCVHVLKRSGDPLQTGLRWEGQALDTFLKIGEMMLRENVSFRLGRLWAKEAPFLPTFEMQQAELKRLLLRRTPTPSADLQEEVFTFFEQLWAQKAESRPSPATELAAWLLLADFLAYGGMEEV